MRRRFIITCTIFLMIVSAGAVQAQDILEGESCHVSADTTVVGNLFVLCGELTIEGVVEGSVIGGARIANITGEVGGSVYLFGVELHVEGVIGKDVHYAGLALNIHPAADFLSDNGSVLSAGLSHTVHAGGIVPGHITTIGYQLVMDGDVAGEINFWGSALEINGVVGRDVTATVGNSESGGASTQIETLLIPFQVDVSLIDPGLLLSEDGQIRGQLEYTGPTFGVVEGETGSPPIFNSTQDPLLLGTAAEQSAQSIGRYLRVVVREFSSLAFVGLLCVLLIPRHVQVPIRRLQTNPVSMLGVGMLSFILSFPIVLILAILSAGLIFVLATLRLDNVVLFTAIVLGLANVGTASVFYFVAIYIARVVVALAVGRLAIRLIFGARDDDTWRYLVLSMIGGVLVLSFIGSIPVIGIGLNALVLFLGLGAILSVLREQYLKFRNNTGATPPPPPYQPDFLPRLPSLPYLPDEAAQFPPPLVEDESPDAGMDNLPPGFNWWRSDYPDDGA